MTTDDMAMGSRQAPGGRIPPAVRVRRVARHFAGIGLIVMSAFSVGVMIFVSLWTLTFVMAMTGIGPTTDWWSEIWYGLLWLCPLFGAVVTGLHHGRRYPSQRASTHERDVNVLAFHV